MAKRLKAQGLQDGADSRDLFMANFTD